MTDRLVPLVALLATFAFAASADVPRALPGAEAFPASLRTQLAKASADRTGKPRTRHLDASGAPLYTNRLLLESSPYLIQHANNPVDWYPWGDDAFEAARRLERPVFVSIGYSTCHWCHVMEEESFDDVETARLLNEHFVAIKVDREVRPDVDAMYMSAVQAMGQSGGWPLSVFVTPSREPFFGGTYFPPEPSGGRPGFKQLLTAIHEQYTLDPKGMASRAAELAAHVARQRTGDVAASTPMLDYGPLRTAAASYARHYDAEWGGTRQRVKFPSALPVPFLLRWHRRSGDERALEMATHTLDRMASGGLRDQLGGAFHRYSTDERWLVPHFEMMLYDNALLAMAYLEAWQATGREDFARYTREVLAYVEREMGAPGGGFHSASDADSPGPNGEAEEGLFFTWTPAEVNDVLGAADGAFARAWFGVSEEGVFEGRSVLHTWSDRSEIAQRFDMQLPALDARIERVRRKLLEAREARPRPARDEKVLAAWNGLMLSAFARAGFALGDAALVERARRVAEFVLAEMIVEGRLQRMWIAGGASGTAFLDDHAFLIAGLLDLYEADPEPRWLREAMTLQEALDERYADAEGGGYYRTRDDAETLFAREKPARDGALPSGNAVSAMNLLRLASFTSEAAYRERAALSFAAFHGRLSRSPTAHSEWLLALDFALDTPKEVLVVHAAGGDADALLDVMRSVHLPNRILSVVAEGSDLDAHAQVVPLLRFKEARGGQATAYVCENKVCKQPTTDPQAFGEQLRAFERLPDESAE
jgi:uncharacterized protein YyaL (SSP411 family)